MEFFGADRNGDVEGVARRSDGGEKDGEDFGVFAVDFDGHSGVGGLAAKRTLHGRIFRHLVMTGDGKRVGDGDFFVGVDRLIEHAECHVRTDITLK